MNTETKEPIAAEDGVPILLPPHLTENFEKAESEIRKFYGLSPGVTSLVRLWLGCGTSSQIRKAFELIVLDIKKPGRSPKEEDYFDVDEP
jgi:hypothetical protein